MSVSNVSNNCQTAYGSSNSTPSDTVSIIQVSECDGNSTVETEQRNNLKNKQLAAQDKSSNIKKEQDQGDEAGSSSTSHKSDSGIKMSEENGVKKRKKRRGISFPKDSYISSYFEPPDPWKNAPPWTTDDLIAAYKKSCELHGTKPIVKVLQQLHTISTPGKREESFILKGEKLDHKHVECVEEVLRRVQFQLVDLEGSHLDDECAVALFDMIEYYESACQLNISSNRNIGARGWQACSRLVRRTPTLNYLDMRNCDLNERTIPIFGRALKMGCHLTILHMENMALCGRPLLILVAALKMNETLQELFLAENKLLPTDGVQLGNLMRYNHKLNLLDLRKNLLQDVGVTHLCDGLIEQGTGNGLRTLVLWNNQITYQAMPSLGRVLAASQSIETLNIGHNNITNEGIHLLKDGLLKTNSLLRIGLQGTGVSDEGAVALAEFLADSIMLLRIDLRDNEIKTGGLMALSHAMRVNSSVTRIDLDKDTKKESVIKDYAEQQSRLLRDILTFQQRNIQTAVEREDQERAELERLAIEAAEAREKKKAEQDEGENTTESSLGSFTVISDEKEVVDVDQEQQEPASVSDKEHKHLADADEAQVASETSAIPSLAVGEEHASPAHQRPNVLIPRKKLQPQESLDSPQPAPNHAGLQSKPTHLDQATPTKPLHHPNLPLVMPREKELCTNTPAEMLLSPQYYPKQLARKIFSVTHVSEESCSSSALPSSDSFPSDFDPLNVCRLSNANSSTGESLSEFLMPISSQLAHSSTVDSNRSPSFDAVISPTTLVRDMADETVKQIVIIDEAESSENATPLNRNCLSSDDAAPEEGSSQSKGISEAMSSLGITPAFDSEEVSSDSEMPSSQPVESFEADEGGYSLLQNSEENANTCQDLSYSPESQLNSNSESSHIDVSGKDINSVTQCEETKSSVLSVMNGEGRISEKLQKDATCNSNADVAGCDKKETTAHSSDVHNNCSVDDASKEENAMKHVDPCENSLKDAGLPKTPIDSLVESVVSSSHLNEHQTTDNSLPKDECNLIEMPTEDKLAPPKSQGREAMGKSGSQSSFSDVESALDIDNVDISLEEEPWTAVEKLDSKGETGKQPDFFTTLSMNGLTQELASALTSLDVSTREEDSDLKPHDEFERELDAMLAEVKSDFK